MLFFSQICIGDLISRPMMFKIFVVFAALACGVLTKPTNECQGEEKGKREKFIQTLD